MTQIREGRRNRAAVIALVVVALSLTAFFAQLGLLISFCILAIGLLIVGVVYLIDAKRPAGD
jgi:hypothetical protein